VTYAGTLAEAYMRAGQMEKAKPFVFHKTDSSARNIRKMQAIWLLKSGHLAKGMELFDYTFDDIYQAYSDVLQAPRWGGEDLEGKDIAIMGFSGFGDSIQSLRFLPEIRKSSRRVIIGIMPQMHRLITKNALCDELFHLMHGPSPRFDYFENILSLPWRLQRNAPDISGLPYLRVLPEDLTKWHAYTKAHKNKLRVGLCWAGNIKLLHDMDRTINGHTMLSKFADLHDDICFYSLQIGDRRLADDTYALQDPSSLIEDFYDTAGLITVLDLVITVDTAVSHLAGALGKSTWLILPTASEWRWGCDAETTVWYQSMRLWPVPLGAGWDHVLDQIATALVALCETR
ncbi:MAG: hypothetical protein AAF352_09195, partial [Pseudomonadota bacterium]